MEQPVHDPQGCPMMRFMRSAWWGLATLVVVLGSFVAWWLTHPSSAYINVLGYSVEKVDGEWIATSARTLPKGPFHGDWRLVFTVISPEHSYICGNEGSDYYENLDGRSEPESDASTRAEAIVYSVSPWADRCLDSTAPVFVEVTRTVRLFNGWLPLRPVEFRFQVLPPVAAASTLGGLPLSLAPRSEIALPDVGGPLIPLSTDAD